MADALATVAFETLRDLLVEQVKFLHEVSDQVEQVERDLKIMHSLLIDADKWSDRYDRASLRDWIDNLKNLAFKAENVLEKYAVEVTSKKEGRDLKKKLKRLACIFNECFSVHQVGKETEDIRSGLTDLTERLRSLSRRDGSSGSAEDRQQYLLRLRYAHEVEQHFVGMEDDIAKLVSMVKDDDQRCRSVVSICGMGGLGKTTLARKIYHHREVQDCFGARAWVCVTQEFQAKTVFSQILKQLLPDDEKKQINSMEPDELVVKLHNFLVQRKCLIVVDDIWEIDHWNILKPAFPNTNCQVVLTTRNENIVSQECVYKLSFLTEDQGWELLQKIALLPGNDVPVPETELSSLERIGRQMVQKCGRLPLAISVIGGILSQKRTLAEWENVSSNIDSYLKHGEGAGNNKMVKQVLDLSYDVLPYYLKPCFLYLGCFHEDEEIETVRLYSLWMAEGLISSQDKGSNETLRDVAERYLTELAFRCMVQVQKTKFYSPHDKFASCRLHDLMHDLCSSKAEEEKFLKRVSFPNIPSSISTSVSRLAICVDDSNTLSIKSMGKRKDLRSLLVLRREQSFGQVIHFEDGIINFDESKRLRVLVLYGCEIKGGKLLSTVGELIHLRYLSLKESHVEELPPSVCNLPYLQTLDLRVSNSIKLPNVICKIKRLRHLLFEDFDVIGEGKLILDGLKELEILFGIRDRSVCIADIPKLTNLRKLYVAVEDAVDSLSIIAKCMSNNQSQLRETYLLVGSCDFSSEESTNAFKTILMSPSLVILGVEDCQFRCGFPRYQQGMCKNLVTLALHSSKIGGDVMGTLGKYPMLQELALSEIELLEKEMIFGANSFLELKCLELEQLHDLKKWEVEERAMPKLTEITILGCDNLEMIPDGVRFVSTLQELSCHMPKEFNDRLRDVDGEPGADYYKVSHIPLVYLSDDDSPKMLPDPSSGHDETKV